MSFNSGGKKESFIKKICRKIVMNALDIESNEIDRGAYITLGKRSAWLCKHLEIPYESQSELVFRVEHEGVHIQLVQASKTLTNATMHFPTIGDDGKMLQCSWAFNYSNSASFSTITAAIHSAVIMADKYYGASDANN